METIICTKCQQEKPDNEFQCRGLKNKPALCKRCYAKKRYEIPEIKDKIKSSMRRRYENPEIRCKIMDTQKKHRCKIETKEKTRIRMQMYGSRPEVKIRIKEYGKILEVIEKRKARYQRQSFKDDKRVYDVKPEVKQKKRDSNRTAVLDARPSYIKQLIWDQTGGALKAKDIPLELIEIKIASLLLNRTLKQKQQQDEQHTTTNI